MDLISGGIIDFHTHIFPEELAGKAVSFIGSHYGIRMKGNGLIEGLLKSADEAKIERMVILSSATKPSQTATVNRWMAERQRENQRFIAFGTVHPHSRHLAAELEDMMALGLRGIKLHPDFQAFNIDDPRMDVVYRTVGGRLPILMHVGDPNLDHSSPTRLRRVIDRFPDLRIVAAHLGGYSRWDEARRTILGLPVWIDTSSALWCMPPEEAEDIIRSHGVGRVVFGTDYPVHDHATEMVYFNRLALTQAERQAILHDNAAALLGLDEGRRDACCSSSAREVPSIRHSATTAHSCALAPR